MYQDVDSSNVCYELNKLLISFEIVISCVD